ncbi:MAG: queuosine precursor transporter [Bacteroidetes bacterium]|nr:queuosine precursor transporter [Bacteroidota bacterium]
MKFNKPTILFLILGSFFITNALVAEFIGVKIFSFENSIGFKKFDWNILGFEHLSLELTCGVLLWPVVIIMTDIINEYYGKKGIKILSYIAAAMISFAFLAVFTAMHTSPAEWWVSSGSEKNISNMQNAYTAIFGQGLWIIIGSLFAFLVGQIIDVIVFHWLKKKSGEKNLWLRSTGSTLVSQLIDSFIVLFIAFYIGNNWTLEQVLAICTVNYIYKFSVAVLLTPFLYLIHYAIDNYLGKDLAAKMLKHAAGEE